MPLKDLAQSQVFRFLRFGQFALAIAIFAHAALSPISGQQPLPLPDYVLHFIGNCMLMLSCWVGLAGKIRTRFLPLIVIPFSALVELAQSLTSSRTTDPQDLMANMAGIAVGLVICLLVEKLLQLWFSKS